MTDHVWTITAQRHDDEFRRWQRTCRACGDRVTAFRATAIYQFGADAEQQPHAVPLSDWPEFAECRAPAARHVAEHVPAYAAARHQRRSGDRGRGLKPLSPAAAVNQLMTRIREQRGWTQEQLAEQLDIDPSNIRRWQNGAQPSGYAALRLARLALLTHNTSTIRPLLRRHRAA